MCKLKAWSYKIQIMNYETFILTIMVTLGLYKRLRLRLRLFIDLTEVQTTVLSMFTNRIQK